MDLIQTQIAFFFKHDFKKDFEYFSLALKEIFGSSKKTLQIPLGDSEPSEIPRLTLNYNGFNINVAKSRLDLFILDPAMQKDVLERIIEKLFDKLGLAISRLGYVKSYFMPSDISVLKKALNADLQKRELNEINLRISEKKVFLDFQCNDIEKIDFGSAQKVINGVPQTVEGLIIQRDVNTAFELDIILSEEHLKKLVNEFEKITSNRLIKL